MEITRGDTKTIRFQRRKNGEVITTIPDEIYFTVKENYKSKDYVFQKRLSRNEINFNEEDNYYYIEIYAEDTDNLYFDITYDYDIEIVNNGNKFTKTGTLKINKEVTWAENEV